MNKIIKKFDFIAVVFGILFLLSTISKSIKTKFFQDLLPYSKAVMYITGIILGVYLLVQVCSLIILILKNKLFFFNELKHNYAIFWSISLIVVSIVVFSYADKFSPEQAQIAGNSITAVAAFMVLFASFSREKSHQKERAQSSALILGQILSSIYRQFERVRDGTIEKIIFPKSWIDLYCDCSRHLKYEYWESISKEFEYVEQFNCAFPDKEKTREIIEKRHSYFLNSADDFDVISTCVNLKSFGLTGKELLLPWKKQQDNVAFKAFFAEHCSDFTEKMTVEYLKSHLGNCNSVDAAFYVLDKVKNDEMLKSGKFKVKLYENKVVLDAIYQIYIDRYSIDKSKLISLVWGELHLKEDK